MGIFLPWSYLVKGVFCTMSLLNWASHWRQQRCCLIFPWWRISLLHCCNQARHLWEIRSRKSFWAPFLWVIQLIGDDVSSLKFNPEHGLGVIKCFVMQRFWNQPQKTNKQTKKTHTHIMAPCSSSGVIQISGSSEIWFVKTLFTPFFGWNLHRSCKV